MQDIQRSYEIIFVNDGSTDDTLNVLLKAKSKNSQIRILNLSRNFGKEAALTAGLEHAMGEVVIPIDADLQHPPEIIIEFIKKWEDGFDVVVGKRTVRTGEGVIKKLTAKYFYKFHNQISDVEIPYNVGDFRLMSRKVIEALKRLPENQRFMKGLFAWVGFNTAVVEYEQAPRAAGKTSYNGWKLWDFALDGITSFSTLPLRIWMYIGFLISFLSFLYGSAIVINTLILGVDTPGYASMITVILFLGGIQLIGIGILGEYIGRIYKETKKRPLYIIEKEY
jgi:glycosyltransferase involved in cell wall biosynthesis